MSSASGRKRLLLATVVAVAVTLAIGASSVLGTTAAPPASPSLPDGELQASPPAMGYVQTGPRLGDASIAKIAQEEAALAGDAAPGSRTGTTATMSAVNTTLAAAVDTNPSTTMQASNPSMEALLESEVVVVVLHGQFTLSDAPVPPGAGAPTGSVLTLMVDSHSGWIDQRELTNSESPGLAALGTPRMLSAPVD